MGKKINYYNAKGQKIEKEAYDKSTCCSVTINKGTWDLLLICPATKEMLDAVSVDLGQWLKLRKENMAEDWKNGSEINVHDEKPDQFTVILPNCKIKDEHINTIGGWWNDWCNNLINPAPASDDKKDDKSDGQPNQDPPKDKSDGDQPQNQPPKQPDPKPAAPAPKKFYEMTPEELFEYNIKERERMEQMAKNRK